MYTGTSVGADDSVRAKTVVVVVVVTDTKSYVVVVTRLRHAQRRSRHGTERDGGFLISVKVKSRHLYNIILLLLLL